MEFHIDAVFQAAVNRWQNGEQLVIDNPISIVSPDTLRERVLRGWQVPPCPDRIEQIYNERQVKQLGIAACQGQEVTERPSDLHMEQKWATRMD